jgi:hypothetical protein
MAAKLARFYGWSPSIIEETPLIDLVGYFHMIEKVEAEERLMDITVADYPHLSKSARSKVHKNLSKLVVKEQETITSAELAKKLGMEQWQTKKQK